MARGPGSTSDSLDRDGARIPAGNLSVQSLRLLDSSILDGLLTDYFDSIYNQGGHVGEAEKTKAAVCHYCDFLDYFGRDLQRASRALAGFKKDCAGFIEVPLASRGPDVHGLHTINEKCIAQSIPSTVLQSALDCLAMTEA